MLTIVFVPICKISGDLAGKKSIFSNRRDFKVCNVLLEEEDFLKMDFIEYMDQQEGYGSYAESCTPSSQSSAKVDTDMSTDDR